MILLRIVKLNEDKWLIGKARLKQIVMRMFWDFNFLLQEYFLSLIAKAPIYLLVYVELFFRHWQIC